MPAENLVVGLMDLRRKTGTPLAHDAGDVLAIFALSSAAAFKRQAILYRSNRLVCNFGSCMTPAAVPYYSILRKIATAAATAAAAATWTRRLIAASRYLPRR